MKKFFAKVGAVILLILSGIGLFLLNRELGKRDSLLDETLQKDGDLSEKAIFIEMEISTLEAKKEALKEKRENLKVDLDWNKKEE